MKQKLLVIIMVLTFAASYSQDVITKKNGDDIASKVIELTPTEVKYKKIDNPDGPIYTILKSDVLMIRYENGTKDIFNETVEKESPVALPSSERLFFVEKTEEGYEQVIVDKLINLKRVVTTNQETSFYTVKCVITKTGGWGVPWVGSVAILETKTGNSILVSKSAKQMVSALKGFQSPRVIIFSKIADDYLSDLLLELDRIK